MGVLKEREMEMRWLQTQCSLQWQQLLFRVACSLGLLFVLSHFSPIQLFATSWTVAVQGISQIRILEGVAEGSSRPED